MQSATAHEPNRQINTRAFRVGRGGGGTRITPPRQHGGVMVLYWKPRQGGPESEAKSAGKGVVSVAIMGQGRAVACWRGLAWLAYLKRYPPPFPLIFVFKGPLVGFDEAPKRPAHGELSKTNKNTRAKQCVSRGGCTLYSYQNRGAICLPKYRGGIANERRNSRGHEEGS